MNRSVLIAALLLVSCVVFAAYDGTKPADDGYIASAPGEIRANFAGVTASMTAVEAHVASSVNPHGNVFTQTNASFTSVSIIGRQGTNLFGGSCKPLYYPGTIGAAYPMPVWSYKSIIESATSSDYMLYFLFGPATSTADFPSLDEEDNWSVLVASVGGAIPYTKISLSAPSPSNGYSIYPSYVDFNGNSIASVGNASITVISVIGSTASASSAKAGFNEDSSSTPSHWSGAVCDRGQSSVYYFLGPRSSVPTTYQNYDGWMVRIASAPGSTNHYLKLFMPGVDGTDWNQGDAIQIEDGEVSLGGKKVVSAIDGTADSDVCTVGQMNAAVAGGVGVATRCVVIANMHNESTGVATLLVSPGGGENLASFPYEVLDTNNAYDGATFTAPYPGVYEVDLEFVNAGQTSGSDGYFAAICYPDSTLSGSLASPSPTVFYHKLASCSSTIDEKVCGRTFINLDKNDTFVINFITGTRNGYVKKESGQIKIEWKGNLPW